TSSRANWPARSELGTGETGSPSEASRLQALSFFQTSALRARRYLIARRNHRWRHAYLKQQSRRRCIGSYPAEHRLSMPRNGPGALEYAHTKSNFNHFFPSNNARQGFKDHSPLSSGGIYRMTQTLSG